MARYRKPLAATYSGLMILGAGGGVGLASLSLLMLFFREVCEPALRLFLSIFIGRRTYFRYDPDTYYFWVGAFAVLAVLWFTSFVAIIAKKPSEDRHVDTALRQRLNPTARGAPIE